MGSSRLDLHGVEMPPQPALFSESQSHPLRLDLHGAEMPLRRASDLRRVRRGSAGLDLHGAEMPLRLGQRIQERLALLVSIFTAPRCPCDPASRERRGGRGRGLDLHGAEMPLRPPTARLSRRGPPVSIFTAPRCPCDPSTRTAVIPPPWEPLRERPPARSCAEPQRSARARTETVPRARNRCRFRPCERLRPF